MKDRFDRVTYSMLMVWACVVIRWQSCDLEILPVHPPDFVRSNVYSLR